jgi:hypothetical protein
MPSAFLFNSTGTKITGGSTVGAAGDWSESNSTSSATFPCSLQPVSVSEADLGDYEGERSTALYKMYWTGYDSAGTAISFKVDDKVSVSSTTYQVIGVSMDMAGRARVYKAILQRVT